MIRICPKRDARCPHGDDCPYAIDRYSCADEPASRPMTAPNATDLSQATPNTSAEPKAAVTSEQLREAVSAAKDEAATFVFETLAEALKLVAWTIQDGSESWDGDVIGTLWHILYKAGVIDEWDNSLATTKLAAANTQVAVLTAALAAERERCAKIAEDHAYTGEGTEDRNDGVGMFARGNRNAKRAIAAAIRNPEVNPHD